MATKKEAFRKAFVASIPILCSYLFLGMAYGILMQEQGFGWLEALTVSAVVYTGAYQFVLITFLSSGIFSPLSMGMSFGPLKNRNLPANPLATKFSFFTMMFRKASYWTSQSMLRQGLWISATPLEILSCRMLSPLQPLL